MPSSATITASDFKSFSPGTKARSTEVNGNFNIFRGHILPVDASTSAAANNAYDLGSSEYQWRNVYLQNAPFIGGVQVGSMNIEVVHDGDNPPVWSDFRDNMTAMQFQDDQDQDIRFTMKVPPEFTPGNVLGLNMYGFCDATSNSYWVVETELYQPTTTGGTQSDTTTALNVNTGTATITAPSAAGKFFQREGITMTAANGLINSLTITAGDVLAVNLKRVSSHTNDSMAGSYFLSQLQIDLNL